MTQYRFEHRLRQKAKEFIESLTRAGLEATIIEDSLREYSVRISIKREDSGFGAVVLYYKPTSDSFKLSTHELKDKSIAETLQDCWQGEPEEACRASGYEVYVDGSFTRGATGYGAVILKNGNVIEELSGGVDAAEVAGTYQIAGELAAVKKSLDWCGEHSVNEVTIFYDYLGIEKWATGKWKTNQPLTQQYARFVSESPVRIHWRKVDSHTGNRWNDRADLLAKKGAGSIQASETNLISELLERTESWIEFLMLKGIEACLDRVYNEQFVRVLIVRDEESAGVFDLYNTRKKRFSPYLHDFRDEELKTRIEKLWAEFSSVIG